MLSSQCINPNKCDPYLFTEDELQWIDCPDSAYYLINGTDTVLKKYSSYSLTGYYGNGCSSDSLAIKKIIPTLLPTTKIIILFTIMN